MKCFSIEVEWDHRVYEQVGQDMENRGTKRATTTVNIIARNEDEALEAISGGRMFYDHQNPKFTFVKELKVHTIVQHLVNGVQI